jgi:hypothetical protein
MDYKTYKAMGVGIIGSGAIESAHRALIQSRCKQSGQVWGINGLQSMLNLRTVYQNNDLKKIRTISIKQAAYWENYLCTRFLLILHPKNKGPVYR